MKVSKIVREFVEEEVNKKYPMPEQDKTAIALLDKDIESIKERIKKEAGEFVFNKLKEAGIQLDERIVGIKIIDWRYYDDKGTGYYSSIINNLRNTYENACQETETKRATAIKNILVNLELGGTKKELMEMLANLPD